jgi:hypothetical protein
MTACIIAPIARNGESDETPITPILLVIGVGAWALWRDEKAECEQVPPCKEKP